MGTDIHGVFQRRTANKWADVPSKFEENRHYQLFAVLAGVRNGHGFAGVKTGEPVTPIAEPRGLPADFNVIDGDSHPMEPDVWASDLRSQYYEPGDEGYGHKWMGDHSHSWLSAREILDYAEKAPIVEKCGVISRKEFATWNRCTAPDSYCGDAFGPDVKVIAQIDAESGKAGSHVRVRWHSSLRKELAYFFDEVARLEAEYGEVRYVFGFDS